MRSQLCSLLSFQLCWAQIELEAEFCIPQSFRAQLSSSEQDPVDAPSHFCAESIIFAHTPQFAICSYRNSKQLKQRPYHNVHAVMHWFGKKFLWYSPTHVQKVENRIWKGNSFGLGFWFFFNWLSPGTDVLKLNGEFDYGGLFYFNSITGFILRLFLS